MTDMPSDREEGRGWNDENGPDQGKIVVRRYDRRGGGQFEGRFRRIVMLFELYFLFQKKLPHIHAQTRPCFQTYLT